MNREEALEVIEALGEEYESGPEVDVSLMANFDRALDYLKSEAAGPMVRVEDVFDTFNKYVSSLPDPSLLDFGQFLTVIKNNLPRYPGVDADAAAREIATDWMGIGDNTVWVERVSENDPQRAAMTGCGHSPRLYRRDDAIKRIAAIINRHVKGAANAENH